MLGEIGEDFHHYTAKFEAVPGKTTGDADAGAFRMGVNPTRQTGCCAAPMSHLRTSDCDRPSRCVAPWARRLLAHRSPQHREHHGKKAVGTHDATGSDIPPLPPLRYL